MVTSSKEWKVIPLVDSKVKNFVIPRKSLHALQEKSRDTRETTGLLYGIVDDKAVYFLGCTILGHGDRTSCQFEEKFRNFHNVFVSRAHKMYPGLVTILYHNHPRLAPHEMDPKTLDTIRDSLRAGVFDYLQDHGILPTLEEAIAEVSRDLSVPDHQATFGRAHVLLTDTRRYGDDFSQVNAYKFDADGLKGVDRFRLILLEDVESRLVHCRIGGICASLKSLHQKTAVDHFGVTIAQRQC